MGIVVCDQLWSLLTKLDQSSPGEPKMAWDPAVPEKAS